MSACGPRPECAPAHAAADEEATCPRCGAEMIWTKASWHCFTCRYKEGCCG
jgi:hypothetical protein